MRSRIPPLPFRPRPTSVLFLALLLLAPALVRADSPSELRELEGELAAALAAGDDERALTLAVRVNDAIEPRHVDALYTVARLHARLGHEKEAFDWLERAGAAGLLSVQELRADEAFAALREQERFLALTRAVWLKGYLWLLERPERDVYQLPARVIETLALRPGERVADVGAGSGYFTVRLARAVGEEGTVWALDINETLLEHLRRRVGEEGLTNVRVAKVAADDPGLPPGGVDTVLMVDTLHYVRDRAAYARRLRAGLAPGGRIVIIDFRPKPLEERPWGPPPEQKMAREEVDAAMAAAGLVPAAVHDFLSEQFFVEYRAAADAGPPGEG
jgi:ubiquinone/menaquinone biosynthesis C-methylase UbiE